MEYQTLFVPQGVAVFGSAAPGKLACVLINRLIEGGFENIYAVNPKAQGVGSIPGSSSLVPLKGSVDLAVIAAPAATVKDIMEDCGQAGVKAAVIITSGFSEVGNVAGEQEIQSLPQKYGIRFIGPNCAGLVNTHSKLIATLKPVHPRAISQYFTERRGGGIFIAMAKNMGWHFQILLASAIDMTSTSSGCYNI